HRSGWRAGDMHRLRACLAGRTAIRSDCGRTAERGECCPLYPAAGIGRLLALGGVAIGAVVTFDQVKATREARSIDLFTKAIDLLASDQVSVRQGGVYALEQLSGLDDDYRGHAHALLALLSASRYRGHPLSRAPRYRQTGHGPMVASPTTSRP